MPICNRLRLKSRARCSDKATSTDDKNRIVNNSSAKPCLIAEYISLDKLRYIRKGN